MYQRYNTLENSMPILLPLYFIFFLSTNMVSYVAPHPSNFQIFKSSIASSARLKGFLFDLTEWFFEQPRYLNSFIATLIFQTISSLVSIAFLLLKIRYDKPFALGLLPFRFHKAMCVQKSAMHIKMHEKIKLELYSE